MRKKSGFTLVELLVGMAILVALMVIVAGVINPMAMITKARDSRRKSDLNKIKTAFEEYLNDKGGYPSNVDLTTWNVKSNCGKVVDGMSKYLKSWPCDPGGNIYLVVVKDNWFKAVTNLENKKDDDIPPDWYLSGTYSTSGFNKNTVNYGVSSTNVLWYEGEGECDRGRCFSGSNCNVPVNGSCNEKIDGSCYNYSLANDSCNDSVCKVSCCGSGCNE